MKHKTHIFFPLLILTTLIITGSGCSNSHSDPPRAATSDVVETKTMGAHTKAAPALLTQSTYRIPASQTSYAAFSLSEQSTVGYVIPDGTVEVYNADGILVYSDIFFPVGNLPKTVSLDAGAYLIKIQNSIKEDSSFTIFSEEMGLECTTIRSSETLRIAGKTQEFMDIDVQKNQVKFQATMSSGTVTLFDPDHMERVPASHEITTFLSVGHYILLVDNADSQTYGTLDVVMQ